LFYNRGTFWGFLFAKTRFPGHFFQHFRGSPFFICLDHLAGFSDARSTATTPIGGVSHLHFWQVIVTSASLLLSSAGAEATRSTWQNILFLLFKIKNFLFALPSPALYLCPNFKQQPGHY
jgi:hypothetical protein